MGYGFATGLVDISMMPLFSYLVDIRHTGVYGNVYAIGDLSWAVSFAIGNKFSAYAYILQLNSSKLYLEF